MGRIRLARLGAAALLAAVPALVGAPPSPAAGKTVEIKYFQYVDQVVEVPAGQPLTWKNVEPLGASHNVIVTHFSPPGGGAPVDKVITLCKAMKPGDKPCVRKDLAKGTYRYTCTVGPAHEATMHGLVRVT